MKIKEAASLCGISTKSIRYYEDMGLLDVERGNNGYREFSEEQVARLQEICLFRSLDVSVEDIKSYYDDDLNLDAFLGMQMEKQQEKIYGMQENKQFMLKLQQNLKKCSLGDAYEERCQIKGIRNDQQELEKQYLSKTKRGKQFFLLMLVWGVAIALIFDLSISIDSAVTFGWVALTIFSLAALLSILLWFSFSAHHSFLKFVEILCILEELPEYLDRRMEKIIPWYWVRKLTTFLLAFVLLFGSIGLVILVLSLLF